MKRLAIFAALLCLSGCNLFLELDSTSDIDLDANADQADLDDTDFGSADDGGDLPIAVDIGTADQGDDMAVDVGQDMVDMVDMADMTTAGPCADPQAEFCSGFEDPTFSDFDVTNSTAAALAHETTIVYSGSGALKVELLAASGTAYPAVTIANPLTNNDRMWIRYMVYVPSGDTFDRAIEVTQLTGTGASAVTTISPSSLNMHVHQASEPSPLNGSFTVPRDTWVCVEADFRTSESPTSANGEFKLAADGATVAEQSDIDWQIPDAPLSTFSIGVVYSSSAQMPTTLYFDDVFVGRNRPGCP